MGLMDRFADPSLFSSLGFGEKMMGSFITMIMGMGITFCVLVLLWAFVAVMGKLIGGTGRKKKVQETQPVSVDKSQTPVVQAGSSESEDVIAAVITAAIAAYRESGGTNDLVVKKITRINGNSNAWSDAGINDCIESRKF